MTTESRHALPVKRAPGRETILPCPHCGHSSQLRRCRPSAYVTDQCDVDRRRFVLPKPPIFRIRTVVQGLRSRGACVWAGACGRVRSRACPTTACPWPDVPSQRAGFSLLPLSAQCGCVFKSADYASKSTPPGSLVRQMKSVKIIIICTTRWDIDLAIRNDGRDPGCVWILPKIASTSVRRRKGDETVSFTTQTSVEHTVSKREVSYRSVTSPPANSKETVGGAKGMN